jgi:D-alanyl-D-alanine carboxypeptidase
VTNDAVKMIGTTANLKIAHSISINDLLYGVMLPSGNDAAYLLAEIIGYFITFASLKKTNRDILSKF